MDCGLEFKSTQCIGPNKMISRSQTLSQFNQMVVVHTDRKVDKEMLKIVKQSDITVDYLIILKLVTCWMEC